MESELAQHLTSACPLIRKLAKNASQIDGIKHLCLENYACRILYLFEYKGYEFETWYFDPAVYGRFSYLYEFRLRKAGSPISVRTEKTNDSSKMLNAILQAIEFVKENLSA